MENHPIPQDITGFQFKLIGSMTVRQFVYIAIVVLIGWFISFLLPIPQIISWPISIVLVALGLIFTFVPVDGRPMDTMLVNLIHALLSPTKYLYGKQGGDITKTEKNTPPPITNTPEVIPLPAPVNNATSQTVANTPLMQTVEVNNQNQAQPVNLQPVTQVPIPTPLPTAIPIPNQPAPEEIQKAEEERIQAESIANQEKLKAEEAEKRIDEQTAVIQHEIETNKAAEQNTSGDPIAADQKIAELEKMLSEATRQRELLQQEILKINAKLDQGESTPPVIPTQPQETPTTNPATTQPVPDTRVKQVAPSQAAKAGIPLPPEAPNLITGIVKDPRGNPLQNVLVEVKDEEDNPVRAFKTNGLGHFASATSVANGKYYLSFEDPKEENKFDIVEITATGHPILPIEITSVDKREELRRELFN